MVTTLVQNQAQASNVFALDTSARAVKTAPHHLGEGVVCPNSSSGRTQASSASVASWQLHSSCQDHLPRQNWLTVGPKGSCHWFLTSLVSLSQEGSVACSGDGQPFG